MMRRLMLTLGLLVASVAAALWFEQQDGFVLVRIGELTLQSSLFVAVAGVLVFWVLMSLVAGVLRRLVRTPGRLRLRWSEHRSDRAQQLLVDGLVELAEGRFEKAERHLEGTAQAADQPLLHHLLAAIAAQRQGHWQRRDDLLAKADADTPRARVAIGLVQAQLQIEAEQWEQALATLGWLSEKAPRNHRVISLLARVYKALDDQDGLADLLPLLQQQQALPDAEVADIERRALQRELAGLGEDAGSDALAAVWKKLPKSRQRIPALQAVYARALMAADCPATAERELKRWLRQHWSPELVAVYGELVTDPPQRAYEQLSTWLQERPDDPALLYASAQQALRCEFWGQARSYLEAAVARETSADMLRSLAALYEQLDEPEQARQCYRRAVELALDVEPASR